MEELIKKLEQITLDHFEGEQETMDNLFCDPLEEARATGVLQLINAIRSELKLPELKFKHQY